MYSCPKCASEMENGGICSNCGYKKADKKENIIDNIFGSKFFWIWYFITGFLYCCLYFLFFVIGTVGSSDEIFSSNLALYVMIIIPVALLFWWALYYVIIMLILNGSLADPFLVILTLIVFFSLPFIAFMITSRLVEKPRL
ncbi:hypothetical protein [Candidatus Hodarchaeum mangrovi]